MILETLLIEKSITIYISSEPISITKIFDKYKIGQNRRATLVFILKSRIVHNHNLLSNDMCCDIITYTCMFKHCWVTCVMRMILRTKYCGFGHIHGII